MHGAASGRTKGALVGAHEDCRVVCRLEGPRAHGAVLGRTKGALLVGFYEEYMSSQGGGDWKDQGRVRWRPGG